MESIKEIAMNQKKLIELMSAAIPQDAAIGFELAAIHAPNLLIQVDKFAGDWTKKSKRFSSKVLSNYEVWVWSSYPDIFIGEHVPCDFWNIEIDEKRNILVFKKNQPAVAIGRGEKIERMLKNNGWL